MRVTAAALLSLPGWSALAEVNLELRPGRQAVEPGEEAAVRVFAVSDSVANQPFSGVDLIFGWDPQMLDFLRADMPCDFAPCDPGTYLWLQAGFFDDSLIDGINNDLTDGDAFYQLFGQLGLENAAEATPEGLWLTTLLFRPLRGGESQVRLLPQLGKLSKTRVVSIVHAGIDITGTLGEPVHVSLVHCEPPAVEAIGSRYVIIEPGGAATAIALSVSPESNGVRGACGSLFVQADGSLGDTPFMQTSEEWGIITVVDRAITPATTFRVEADCRLQAEGLVSDSVTVSTGMWGDVNGDGFLAISDLSIAIAAAQTGPPQGTTLEQLDIAPCVPDGIIDHQDIGAVQSALSREPFPCLSPCLSTDPTDIADFAECLTGPGVMVMAQCAFFDFDFDGDCDLYDATTFHLLYNVPSQ